MTLSKWRTLIVLLTGLALAGAACSGGSAEIVDTTNADPTTAPAAATAAPAATVAPTTGPAATTAPAATVAPTTVPPVAGDAAIVVDTPVADSEVASPFTVTGMSVTFESNVQWEIAEIGGGPIVASGFTTADQPDVGVPGPFEFVVDVPSANLGDLELRVFEQSAEDGTSINVVRVPLRVTSAAATDWLRVNGFGPADFATSASEVEALVSERFGDPTADNELGECPAGPARLVGWDNFTLLFQDGTFDGWFYRTSEPVLTTPSGVTTGINRADLEAIYDGVLIEESSLGTEFFFEVPAGFIGGIFDEADPDIVESLYAGTTCFFR